MNTTELEQEQTITQTEQPTPTDGETIAATSDFAEQDTAGGSIKKAIESQDAAMRIYVDDFKMQASVFIDPPLGEGKDITYEELEKQIKQNKITYGVKWGEVQRIIDEKIYHTQVVVAEGKPVVDGINGKITDLFPRERKITFKEREDGTINFKEMDLVVNIGAGDPICQIQPPIPGEEGMNIYGVVVRPRQGLAPIPPRGDNTQISEDGLAMVAAINGSLVFRKEKFCVDSVFIVQENVDNSTGNINFKGDVVVKGTVQEGFSVRSEGNVHVQGIVEGASINANGSITLEKGINGMGHGTLTAGGDITSKYMENCSICAGGNIIAESLINCTTEADGDITVSGQQGRIAGGKITAFGSIKTVNIGSRSAVQTMITLGVTPSILKEKNKLDEELKAQHQQNEEMNKNLLYLERSDRLGQVNTDERRAALSALRLKVPMMAMREARLKQKKEQMEQEIQKTRECTLTCQNLLPPVKIVIGNAVLTIQEERHNCRIYRNSDGEISIGQAK